MSGQLDIHANKKIISYLREGVTQGRSLFALRGGRRAGKTYNVCIFLLLSECLAGRVVVVASMTSDQQKEGAYADIKDIIARNELDMLFTVLSSPREVRCTQSGAAGVCGKIVFRSFANSETAKGGACDWLFINEANNFSKQQYINLTANVRIGTICDYNPNQHFWIDEELGATGAPELICDWRDNVAHLTPAQLAWFESLKQKAEAPTATAADIYYYRVYYLGEYGDLSGDIFTPYNMQLIAPDEVPGGYSHVSIFADPSALRGADSFAMCLTACHGGYMYVLDTFSANNGAREDVVRKIIEWCREYDIADIFIETNGIIGLDFFEFCVNSGLSVRSYYSRQNKFERIIANFQNLTTKTLIVDNGIRTTEYLKQVYTFSNKCEHDDNIDALNSSFSMQRFCGYIN